MNLYSSSQATQVYYVPEWNSRETQLGSTTLTLQLNLIWANPWQSRSLWISPKGFQDRKCQALQHCHELCWQRQGHQVPIQKPRRKSNNSVIGEGFDHTYISFADCCFQRAAHLLRKNTQPTNPHTTKKNPPVKEKRWRRLILIFKDWGKRCFIFPLISNYSRLTREWEQSLGA